MISIGMFEAKTHFAQFVDELTAGKMSCFVVTCCGKSVAKISSRVRYPLTKPGDECFFSTASL